MQSKIGNPKSKMAPLPVTIRWLIHDDMPEVLSIEAAAFGRHAWPEEDFCRVLRQRNVIGMVGETNEGLEGFDAGSAEVSIVAGFMLYELHRTRLHLLNFAVDPNYRRRGVGRQMLEKLTGKLCRERRTRLTLEVRETNLDAQLFFRACKLRAVKTLRCWWRDTDEDAYVFQARCG
jgi:ribosomal-protein-alanine N-acetyltransferase